MLDESSRDLVVLLGLVLTAVQTLLAFFSLILQSRNSSERPALETLRQGRAFRLLGYLVGIWLFSELLVLLFSFDAMRSKPSAFLVPQAILFVQVSVLQLGVLRAYFLFPRSLAVKLAFFSAYGGLLTVSFWSFSTVIRHPEWAKVARMHSEVFLNFSILGLIILSTIELARHFYGARDEAELGDPDMSSRFSRDEAPN